MHYKINTSAVIYDIIDDEIVIIHLENGNYYNLSNASAQLWMQIAKTASFDNLITYLSHRYNVGKNTAEKDLKDFLSHLEAEGLVIKGDTDDWDADKGIDEIKAEVSEYHPPVLEVFTDMQDFLLVDPIHEVDEQGLPKYTPPQPDED
jgi:hypothetical protein